MVLSDNAIFCHIGNIDIWYDILPYLQKCNIEYDLYINIMNTIPKESVTLNPLQNISHIKNIFVYHLPNQGCDIGPFLYFMDDLRKKEITYDYIIKLHTKSFKEHRILNLNYFLSDTKSLIHHMKTSYKSISAAMYDNYDYYNFYYDLHYFKKLGIPFEEDFSPNIPTKIPKKPTIYTGYYQQTIGIIDNLNENSNNIVQPHNIFEKIQALKHNIINHDKLLYIPTTFFIFSHKRYNDIFEDASIDLYNDLEKGFKPDDNIVQSRTHSMERVLSTSFFLYDEYGYKRHPYHPYHSLSSLQ